MDEGKHSIELIRGDGATDIQIVLPREDNLKVAVALVSVIADKYLDPLIELCDRARVLARNDLPKTIVLKAGPANPDQPLLTVGTEGERHHKQFVITGAWKQEEAIMNTPTRSAKNPDPAFTYAPPRVRDQTQWTPIEPSLPAGRIAS